MNLTFTERFNVKYQIFSIHKKTGLGFVLILPTTRDDFEILWLCQMSRNDRLYKTKVASKLCHCVSFHEGIHL